MTLRLLALTPLLLTWLGLFGFCRELAARKRIHGDWRLSWMLACAAWSALLVFIIESVSSLSALDARTVIAAWTIACFCSCGTAVWLTWQRKAVIRSTPGSCLREAYEEWRQRWPLDAKLLITATGGLVAALGVIAVTTPTTNWDSLTYHLPRVMHWIQQKSVDHFPTNNTCQIEYGPWSAFATMTLHLLWGSDRLDNLGQWFAMLTCVIVASFIAELLARSPPSPPIRHRISAFASFLVATLPIGVVESITTQNDYVVTCWLSGLTCLLMMLWHEPTNAWYAGGAAGALALGVFTKATMFIYAAPVGMAFLLWWLLRLHDNRLRVRLALIFTLALLVINTPHWMRNYAVFGSPLGSREIVSTQRNKNVSVSGTFSNVLRNLALQTNTGIRPLTDALNASLFWLHRFTGRELDDPDTTFHSGTFGVPDRFLVFDGYACNFYHLALMVTAGAILLRNPKRRRLLLGCFAIVATGFVLFCAMLRWQMWHGRIHIAWLTLLMPWTSAILADTLPRWLGGVVAAGILFFSVICLLHNASRPVFNSDFTRMPREQQYLATMAPQFYEPLARAANDIVASRCERLGIRLGYDDPEYALWILLRNRGFRGRIDHYHADNETARIATAHAEPCIVVASDSLLSGSWTNAFRQAKSYGNFTVLWDATNRP
jgi:hypothetical protein